MPASLDRAPFEEPRGTQSRRMFKERNLFVVEAHWRGAMAVRAFRHKGWFVWKRYSTVKARDTGLANLTANSKTRDWIEFRKGKDNV